MARRVHGGQVGETGIGPIQVSTTSTMTPPINEDMVIDLLGTSRLVVDGTATILKQENVQTTSYTLTLDDQDKVVIFNSASNLTVTVPADSTANFPEGAVVFITRIGSGSLTLGGEGGVTLTKTGTFALNEEIYVRKRAANSWIVVDYEALAGTGGNTYNTGGGFGIHTFTTTGTSQNFTTT